MKMRMPNLRADRFSGIYIGLIFIVIFAIWTPSLFLSLLTLHIIATNQAIPGLIAIAVLIPLTTGNYDLTVGANANFTAVMSVVLIDNQHWGMWAALAAGVGVGMFIGFLNGFIVVVLGVNSFITTLGMATVIAAFQEIISGGNEPLPPSITTWATLAGRTVFGFQIVVYYVLIIGVVAWWVLDRTPIGRYFYAIGSNADASRLSGVAVNRWVWLSLISSGTLCGLAGVLYASLIGPSLTFGPGLLLPAFAAVFLGSTQIDPGRANVVGTFVALVVLGIGVEGLQLVTGVQWLNDMFSGVALLAAVSFAVWRQRVTTFGRDRTSASSRENGAPLTTGEVDDPTLAAPITQASDSTTGRTD
jgi:ribose transport system permease protein